MSRRARKARRMVPPVRTLACACGATFTRVRGANGRPRVTCGRPRCSELSKRRARERCAWDGQIYYSEHVAAHRLRVCSPECRTAYLAEQRQKHSGVSPWIDCIGTGGCGAKFRRPQGPGRPPALCPTCADRSLSACSQEGCPRQRYGRGLCKKHWREARDSQALDALPLLYVRDDTSMLGVAAGHLTVKERAGLSPSGDPLWLCKCDCGTEVARTSAMLRSATPTSGCSSLGMYVHMSEIPKDAGTPAALARASAKYRASKKVKQAS